MTKMETVENIPVQLDSEEFMGTQRFGRVDQKEIIDLLEEGRQLIEPKAVYTMVKVIDMENEEVFLENDYKINSLVLADMVACGQTIVPHVVTIGPKLEQKASQEAKNSVFRSFILESRRLCPKKSTQLPTEPS